MSKKQDSSVLENLLALQPVDIPDGKPIRAEKAEVIESLVTASAPVLENFRLSRLASAANLQKGLAAVLQQVVDDLADAKLAELLLHRAEKSPRKTR